MVARQGGGDKDALLDCGGTWLTAGGLGRRDGVDTSESKVSHLIEGPTSHRLTPQSQSFDDM